jgi:hypothetical protein
MHQAKVLGEKRVPYLTRPRIQGMALNARLHPNRADLFPEMFVGIADDVLRHVVGQSVFGFIVDRDTLHGDAPLPSWQVAAALCRHRTMIKQGKTIHPCNLSDARGGELAWQWTSPLSNFSSTVHRKARAFIQACQHTEKRLSRALSVLTQHIEIGCLWGNVKIYSLRSLLSIFFMKVRQDCFDLLAGLLGVCTGLEATAEIGSRLIQVIMLP